MPGMAELEVKEQRPAETNPIEHLGEYIHPPRLEPRTIGHKTRTIGPYRPRGPRNTSCHGGPTGRAATISPTADGRTATLLETPVHSPGLLSSDMPTGTNNANYSPLSRHRPPGRNDVGRSRTFRRTAQGGSAQRRAR